jgi:hypothetical protein
VLQIPLNFLIFQKGHGLLKVIETCLGVARQLEVYFVELSDAVCIVGRLLDGSKFRRVAFRRHVGLPVARPRHVKMAVECC